MARSQFETLRVHQLAKSLADEIWRIVIGWPGFEKTTVGGQLVRAADSVGATIAEGSSRVSYQDNRRLVKIARAAMRETRHWLRHSCQRGLLSEAQIKNLQRIVNELAPTLNAYLKSIGREKDASN